MDGQGCGPAAQWLKTFYNITFKIPLLALGERK